MCEEGKNQHCMHSIDYSVAENNSKMSRRGLNQCACEIQTLGTYFGLISVIN